MFLEKNWLKLFGVCEMKLLQEFFAAPDVGDIVHTSEMVKEMIKLRRLKFNKSLKLQTPDVLIHFCLTLSKRKVLVL